MKKIIKTLFILFFIVLLPLSAQDIPKFSNRVFDATNTLTATQKTQLGSFLEKLEKEKGSQIIVGIIETTAPLTIEEFSIKIAQKNKTGRKSIDDGLLLLIAKKDRKMRIEVGYGLEGLIPDARAKQIISQKIIPQLKKGNFFEGVQAGVFELDRIIRAGDLPPVEPVTKKKKKPKESSILDRIHFSPMVLRYYFFQWTFLFQFLLAIGIGNIFSYKSGKLGAFVSSGILVFQQLYYVISYGHLNIFMFFVFPFLSFFVALIFHKILKIKATPRGRSSSRSSSSSSYSPSSSWTSSSSGSSYRSSSSSSYSSSSSSSSSSYSGGGGSFGGGGASGSW